MTTMAERSAAAWRVAAEEQDYGLPPNMEFRKFDQPGMYGLNAAGIWYKNHPTKGNNWVSAITWKKGGEIGNIETKSRHQNKGYASALHQWVKDNHEPNLTHSRSLTPEGRAWAEKVGAVTQDLVNGLRDEFSDWHPRGDFGLGDWRHIEDFMKDRYPAAHRGLETGNEEAQSLLDSEPDLTCGRCHGSGVERSMSGACLGCEGSGKVDHKPYETGLGAVSNYGYDPKEVAAGMLLLHNQSHGRMPQKWLDNRLQTDTNRLNDIAQKRFQMQRAHEQRQHTMASRAVNAWRRTATIDDHLAAVIESFRRTPLAQTTSTPKGAEGNCGYVMGKFIDHARRNGIEAHGHEFNYPLKSAFPNPPTHQDPHDELPAYDGWHHAVRVSHEGQDYAVDWSLRQFDPHAAHPHVEPLETYGQRFVYHEPMDEKQLQLEMT